MTRMHSFSNEFPGRWQLFGEIELPKTASRIDAWLVATLRPLDLKDHFLNKIRASAASVAEGDSAAQVADGSSSPEHLRLLIYTPEDGLSSGQSWGFFRVEKNGDAVAPGSRPERAVAFYLYREGL